MKSYFLSQYNEALRLRNRAPASGEMKQALERVVAAYLKCAEHNKGAPIGARHTNASTNA